MDKKQAKSLLRDILSNTKIKKTPSMEQLLLTQMDRNQNGIIEKEEFLEYFESIKGGEEVESLFNALWDIYDKENKGKIDLKRGKAFIKDILQKGGLVVKDDAILKKFIDEMDSNKNGTIEKQEFHDYFMRYFF